jgi:sugar/nucleoside kinase (ribokinase family)
VTETPPAPGSIDVLGIGNALVDVLCHVDEAFIESNGLEKGSMTLIDTERAESLYAAMGASIEMSGGSAANTIAGIASFGGSAAYLGRVFDDQLGTVFAHDLRASGVVFRCAPAADGPSTGRCLIVVTPDAQRTMNTYLGASEHFGPEATCSTGPRPRRPTGRRARPPTTTVGG